MTEKADIARTASELRLVLGQLTRRLRTDGALPLAQLRVLAWLDRRGPLTASELAELERVRPQSMAETIRDMENDGLVERTPDPNDRRRTPVSATRHGATVLSRERSRRDDWIGTALAERLNKQERARIREAVDLLRRLLDDPER